MRNKGAWIVAAMMVAVLLAAPGAEAQPPSPEEVVQSYYTALGEAAASGEVAAILDLFADDASVMIIGLSPEPVQGKEAIESTFSGMLALLKGLTVTVGDVTVEGGQVDVNYVLAPEGQAEGIQAADTFVVEDGQIQSLTIQLAPEALSGLAQPTLYGLPETGGPVSGLLPGLLVLGGAVLVGLGRRFSR